MPCARPDHRRAGAAFAPALVLLLMLAAHAAPAVAQSWAQTAPVAAKPQVDAAVVAAPPRPIVAQRSKRADFQHKPASPEVQHVAHWAVDSGDTGGMPYMIVDKVNARVFVFDAGGHLQGTEPALLGMVPGDRSVAGLGDRKLSAIRPEDRTTPAGRFVASLGKDLRGQDLLWIDYESSLALHRVVKGTPGEKRAERLQSATAEDNRISYGCINVPVPFFEGVVSPAFTRTSGIVYILPEKSAARALFGSYDVPVDAPAGDPLP